MGGGVGGHPTGIQIQGYAVFIARLVADGGDGPGRVEGEGAHDVAVEVDHLQDPVTGCAGGQRQPSVDAGDVPGDDARVGGRLADPGRVVPVTGVVVDLRRATRPDGRGERRCVEPPERVQGPRLGADPGDGLGADLVVVPVGAGQGGRVVEARASRGHPTQRVIGPRRGGGGGVRDQPIGRVVAVADRAVRRAHPTGDWGTPTSTRLGGLAGARRPVGEPVVPPRAHIDRGDGLLHVGQPTERVIRVGTACGSGGMRGPLALGVLADHRRTLDRAVADAGIDPRQRRHARVIRRRDPDPAGKVLGEDLPIRALRSGDVAGHPIAAPGARAIQLSNNNHVCRAPRRAP